MKREVFRPDWKARRAGSGKLPERLRGVLNVGRAEWQDALSVGSSRACGGARKLKLAVALNILESVERGFGALLTPSTIPNAR